MCSASEPLMVLQRFPKNFDGIVAGAPANYWTNPMTNAANTTRALNKRGAWLSPDELALVSEAAQRACPSADGYLDDPISCRFDLTEAKLDGLEATYAGSGTASVTLRENAIKTESHCAG